MALFKVVANRIGDSGTHDFEVEAESERDARSAVNMQGFMVLKIEWLTPKPKPIGAPDKAVKTAKLSNFAVKFLWGLAAVGLIFWILTVIRFFDMPSWGTLMLTFVPLLVMGLLMALIAVIRLLQNMHNLQINEALKNGPPSLDF